VLPAAASRLHRHQPDRRPHGHRYGRWPWRTAAHRGGGWRQPRLRCGAPPSRAASVLGIGRLDRACLLSWPLPGRTSTGQLCHLRPIRHRTASSDRHLDHRGHPVPASSQAPTSRGDPASGRCRGRTRVARSCAEVLLATNTAGLRADVGPLETRWSLILWNPWFALGGALFIATAIQASRSGFMRIVRSRASLIGHLA